MLGFVLGVSAQQLDITWPPALSWLAAFAAAASLCIENKQVRFGGGACGRNIIHTLMAVLWEFSMLNGRFKLEVEPISKHIPTKDPCLSFLNRSFSGL